jgi:uncharacterized Zn-finger protein
LFESSEVVKPEIKMFDEENLVYETIEEDPEIFIDENFIIDDNTEPIVEEYDWIELPPIKESPKEKLKQEKEEELSIIYEGNQKLFRCELCGKAFKEKSKLKAHREIHTTERNVICPVCNKTFKTQACLRSHKRVHNPTHIFCDYCGKNYTQKPELAKHIKFVHFHLREFACEICGSSFGSKGHLATHLLTHQGNKGKKEKCQVCDLAFHTKTKLERHMKSHTGERNYECGICGKRFLYSYNVTAHIKHVHYRERRKESDRNCDFCGKKFTKLWKLREHLLDVHNLVEGTIEGAGSSGHHYYEQV